MQNFFGVFLHFYFGIDNSTAASVSAAIFVLFIAQSPPLILFAVSILSQNKRSAQPCKATFALQIVFRLFFFLLRFTQQRVNIAFDNVDFGGLLFQLFVLAVQFLFLLCQFSGGTV